jgi:glycogen synthase
LKVLVLSNLYPPDVIGGYELGCRQVVDALRARGHDVRVLTSAPRTPVPSEPHVERRLRLCDVWNGYMFATSRPVTAKLFEAEAKLVDAFNVHALTQAIDDFRPDVAYAWMLVGVGGLGLMATLRHLGVPWLWHLMDDLPLELCRLGVGAGPVEPLLREVDRQLRGSFLACSMRLVEEVEAGGFRLGPDVTVVPNWVVGEAPPPRTRIYEPGQTLRILTAGQINRNKGADHVIEMAARLRDRGIDRFSIDCYGHVDDPFFPALARHRGLERHLAFKGFRPQTELAGLYPNYDVFAFPTWEREPFAFAPLEAMWRGCVPLMSQHGGNAEWAVHGVHCLKAERNPDAFADAIGAIIDGSIDLGPIARRAASVVGRDFHLDRQVPRIEQALETAARKPQAGPVGTADEAYRLALLAEKLARVLVQEVDDSEATSGPMAEAS